MSREKQIELLTFGLLVITPVWVTLIGWSLVGAVNAIASEVPCLSGSEWCEKR